MANRDLPRRGSRPANALSSLLSLGGNATIDAWYRVASFGVVRSEFELLVVERLALDGLIIKTEHVAELTDAARVYLGVKQLAEVWVGKLPEPRTGNGFKPLRARSAMVFRAGAFDYRSSPSIVAGEEVQYKGPTSFAGAKSRSSAA